MLKESIDKQGVFNRIEKAILSVLKARADESNTPPKIVNETDIFSDLGIDSVEVLDLIGLIEGELKMSLDIEKVASKRKVSDIVDIVWNTLCQVKA
jgi:acyl carrier protein